MNFFINWIIMSLAVAISAYLLPGVSVAGPAVAIITGLVIGIINAFIKPLAMLLTLPINVITLGLFTFVINGLLVLLAANLVNGFQVRNFWWAIIFSVVLSIIFSVLGGLRNHNT